MRLPPSLFASLAKVANSHLPPSTTSTPVISALVYFVFRSFSRNIKVHTIWKDCMCDYLADIHTSDSRVILRPTYLEISSHVA